MSYQRKRKTYVLDFEGTDLDGLTVRARSAPIEHALLMEELADFTDAKTGKQRAAQVRELICHFAEVLVEWDLVDDDGAPVPPTAAGLAVLDEDELALLITAYQTAGTGVAAPLGEGSPDGSPSAVPSIPMEPLSESRAS